ncbi:hypothetical protein ElyMa_005408300 [Elysia marginata]|uniref:Uncharacterized protein n=1 Tax=Elysia marginata TaxID=1093978 RepID=A0AAV4EJM3_9GAST|nr:hypothetical protein ElyMa_005408300 [Elysia marginata]
MGFNAAERLPPEANRDREVRGSIPDRVKPRTLKLVLLAADPPSVWHNRFSVSLVGLQALLTSQCASKLSIVHSVVSNTTSKLTETLKFKTIRDGAWDN